MKDRNIWRRLSSLCPGTDLQLRVKCLEAVILEAEKYDESQNSKMQFWSREVKAQKAFTVLKMANELCNR